MKQERFHQLYAMFGPIIHGRCRQLLADDALAEDAMQESFIRVMRHLDTAPERREEALAWIYRIATNYCLNEIRNRRLRPEPVAVLPERGVDGEGPLQARDMLARVVNELPPKLRDVAWLRHVDGLDQEEIARILDVSRRTVANRLERFSKRAQKLLGKEAA